MSERESRPAGNQAADHPLAADGSIITARQTCWLAVHDLVAPILDSVGSWPLLGSPEWCSLPASSARKWAAILDGGQHHALRLELGQQARAEASRAVAASLGAVADSITATEVADVSRGALSWGRIGQKAMRRNDVYIQRQVVS
ncbi:hypothetical protein NJB18091_30090 [Mycobacterium marinum]|uniref:DUF2742 domain-containing protein n=1 Tax=Mycobacterium marinum TaxID=1781 RepID=UPI0021C2EE08|nr:DUF2742 domain-containing protein [Mycobacterium marinum]GJN99522.1 hypothetical protein NJB18091_30090 [Mycobacterium marinum]